MLKLFPTHDRNPKFSDLELYETFSFESQTWMKTSDYQGVSSRSIRIFQPNEPVNT